MSKETQNKETKNTDKNVADAHAAAVKSQEASSTAVAKDATFTVSAGVPAGAAPTEAVFAPGDKVLVEKEGGWYNATIVNVTPIGVADQLTGEKVKYTVNYDAVNGVANYTAEQYVPQSRVKAEETKTDALDVHKEVAAREKAASLAEGRYPTADELTVARTAGDTTEPGSPANNPDLNGAINDPSKAEVENFNGDKKPQSDNTVVNPGGSVSVDADPENQVRVAASDTTAEGAANPAAATASDTADEADLKAQQEKEAKAHEKEVAKEKKAADKKAEEEAKAKADAEATATQA